MLIEFVKYNRACRFMGGRCVGERWVDNEEKQKWKPHNWGKKKYIKISTVYNLQKAEALLLKIVSY